MSGSAPLSILAVDLGGSQIRCAQLNGDLVVAHRQAIPTMAELGPTGVIERLLTLLDSVRVAARTAGEPEPVAVGISAPGPLDAARGVILDPPNLPGWHDIPLSQLVIDATGLPVVLERDTKVALLAEWRHGAARGAQNAIYLTVSTGIGAALVINGQLVDGASGTAGEAGHLTVDLDGPECGDGAPGHLEAIASGSALARQAGAPDAQAVFAAADAGDPVAARLAERAWRATAATCAGLVNLLNPEIIVLGGSIADHRPDLHDAIKAEIARHSFAPAAARVRVAASVFGADVSLVGAVPLIRERLSQSVAARSPA